MTDTVLTGPGEAGAELLPDTIPAPLRTGSGALRSAIMPVVTLVVLVAVWEGYKLIGPSDHVGQVLGWKIIPRAGDSSMPHVTTMLSEFSRPEVRGSGTSVAMAVAAATWYSLRLALFGFALGAVVGLGLAVVMARLDLLRRGILPYLIVSQTVPLIALAPISVSWGGRLSVGAFHWEKWMSAALLGAFLAFFPVAVGALRGLTSMRPESVELMDSYAATWWQGLVKLRLPSAVPFLVPALRLAASAAVVGVVVSEISIGLSAGIGRLILSYSQEATSRPAKVYTAVVGAAVLGLAMALIVTTIERLLVRQRSTETAR